MCCSGDWFGFWVCLGVFRLGVFAGCLDGLAVLWVWAVLRFAVVGFPCVSG